MLLYIKYHGLGCKKQDFLPQQKNKGQQNQLHCQYFTSSSPFVRLYHNFLEKRFFYAKLKKL